MRRNPNGYGGITKLSGKRTRPYMAYINILEETGDTLPGQHDAKAKTAIEQITKAADPDTMLAIFANHIEETRPDDPNALRAVLIDTIKQTIQTHEIKATYRKTAIGYYKTHKEAQIALAKHNESPEDLKHKNVTIAQIMEKAWEEHQQKKNLSQNTIKSYQSKINTIKNKLNIPIQTATIAQLQAVIDSQAGYGTQNITIVVLKMAYEYAIRNGIIQKNNADYIQNTSTQETKKKTTYTTDEIKTIKAKTGQSQTARILYTLIATGMRIRELLALRIEDIHLAEGYIHVKGTKTKNADRIVPIHQTITPILTKETNQRTQGTLYLNPKGKPINYEAFRQTFMAFLKSNHLNENHTIHETRHTFATLTKASKMDATLRAYIIGHANGNITDDLYTHPEALIENLKAEIQTLKIC